MEKGSKEMFSSGRNEKKQKKADFRRVFLLSGLILLLLSGCGAGAGSGDFIIDGRELTLSSEASDTLYEMETVRSLKDKYSRHYQNGLPFEDLSQAEQELNEHFYRSFQEQIRKALDVEAKALRKAPYLLRTRVEFVRSEVKKYARGKRSAEEILRDPDSIMGIKMEYYAFVTEKERRQEPVYLAYDQMERKILGKRLYHDYVKQGVEQVEYWATLYDAAELEKIPLKQLEKEPYPFVALGSDCVIFDSSAYLKTPYVNSLFRENRFDWEENFRETIYDRGIGVYTTRRLEEKYKIPFVFRGGDWYSPAAYPELVFDVAWAEGEEEKTLWEDHFLSVLTQHLLHEKIGAILKELGLEKDVVFLITVRSTDDIYDEENPYAKPYDCSKLNEEEFIKSGFEADVRVIFIYLQETSKEEMKNLEENIQAGGEADLISLRMREGVPELPRVEELSQAMSRLLDLKEYYSKPASTRRGFRAVEVYSCYMGAYEKKIARDLFGRQEITEGTRDPKRELYEAFSERYETRNETQAFHYLDIFGALRMKRGSVGVESFRKIVY